MKNSVNFCGISDKITKCDLCSDKKSLLYPVQKKDDEEKEFKLCKECLKIVHETYVQLE